MEGVFDCVGELLDVVGIVLVGSQVTTKEKAGG